MSWAVTMSAGPEVEKTLVNTGESHVLTLPVTMRHAMGIRRRQGYGGQDGGSGGARTRNMFFIGFS
jgi:hypothetical protein